MIESESKLDLDFSVLRAILDGIERKRARFLITLVLIRAISSNENSSTVVNRVENTYDENVETILR